MLLSSILDRAVRLYPDKEAVCSGEHRFTYSEFGERVSRLAHYLSEAGIGKQDCVAILHDNDYQFLEAYFATAQIGAVLNPLNFRLSPRELGFIINDSRALLLIAATRFTESVHKLKDLNVGLKQVIWTGTGFIYEGFHSINYEEAIKTQFQSPLPEIDISDREIAQLYYTSGTTGKPKGVMLTHRNISTHALAAIAELKLTDRDVWIHAAPLFHLADAWATFAITWVGGRHVMVTEFEPVKILDIMEAEAVTLTNMIPTMLNMLVNTEEIFKYDFSALRVILSGGAPIAPEVVRKIMTAFKCDYIQTYGMTETSPYLTLSVLKENLERLSSEDRFRYKSMTGRPFIGVDLRVVRDDGQEVVPNGKEVGEIIVKGDTVTPGYWNRPEETDQTLKNGWLLTGDMAVINKEGYINIVDRKKDMILTGGENVYSIEVENVLYMHPSILEAAVIGIPDSHWGEIVKACVVLKKGEDYTEEDIINFCKQNIASYKCPKSVVFLEELPRVGSGKIFKKELKEKFSR